MTKKNHLAAIFHLILNLNLSFLPLTSTTQVCHDLKQQMREGGRHLASLERQQERTPQAPFKEPHHEGRGLQNSFGQGV